jgi:L-fuconolactonase
MEVDVDPAQHDAEAAHVVKLCESNAVPTKAAVIGGRPAAKNFHEYIQRHSATSFVKGVRQVLHGESTPPGFCLQDDFVRGMQQLAEVDWSFDLCMRPSELADGIRLAELCPETRFVLDHCGNADPQAFRRTDAQQPSHDPDIWKEHIARFAERPNAICKISGIVARAPQGWSAEDLAPIVNHCLDAFGPDRVIFGGDWPVCLLGAPLADWIEALRQIVSSRSAEDQRKLWHANAEKFYKLTA